MQHNKMLSLAYVVCGALTVLIPLIFRSLKVYNYQRMYAMYNWKEAQEQYEQQREEYYQQQANNANYMAYGNKFQYMWENMKGSFDVNECHWWQLNCFPYYINEAGEPEPANGWYPAWFSGWTQSEEERQRMLEEGETSASMKFVYVWQILMFIVILAYGYVVIRQNRVVTGVTVALVVFTNMAFLSMWLLADASIITDGDYVQRTGFYGQFSVLMFITNAWYLIFGIIFSAIFVIRGHHMHSEIEAHKQDADGQNYKQLEGDSPQPKRETIV